MASSQRSAKGQTDTIRASCRQGRLVVTPVHISLQPHSGSPGPTHFSATRSQLADVRAQPHALLWRTVVFTLRDGQQYRADMVPSATARRILAALSSAADPAFGSFGGDAPTWFNTAGASSGFAGGGLWRRYNGASRRVRASIAAAVVLAVCVIGVGVSGALAGLGGAIGALQTTHSSGSPAQASGVTTATSVPRPTCIPNAVNCNPWGYNFTHGTTITNPPRQFCQYFNCVNSFASGRGYVVECRDGVYSKTGGVRNSCAHHQGEWRNLLAPQPA